jgi:hypothetical protein
MCIYFYMYMFIKKYTLYICMFVTYVYMNRHIYSKLWRNLLTGTYLQICIHIHADIIYCISYVSCLRLSYCINTFVFCVHYLCLIGRVYVFYVGHVDKISLYETLFHCNILSEHHHHQINVNTM